MSATKRWRVVGVGGVTCCLAIAIFIGWLVVGDPISQANWNRVHKGMTKKEVLEILGEPNAYDGGGSEMEYSGFLNAGWVEFHFDEKGVLVEKNDESALGSLH